MRLVRNLTPGEIVGQVMLARDALGEWPKGNMAVANDEDETDEAPQYQSDGRMLTNIVMMGMGEPLYNFDHVRDTLKTVMDGVGLSLSKRLTDRKSLVRGKSVSDRVALGGGRRIKKK